MLEATPDAPGCVPAGTSWDRAVHGAGTEDADLIRAMNRLRRAYLELSPELAPYPTTGTTDDQAGLMQTYTLGTRRHIVLHIVGSTSFFLMTVNAIVAGTLGALVAAAYDGGPAAMTVAGSWVAGRMSVSAS